MTKGQRIALQADWWPAACRKQGWETSDRELRLRVCSWAVSLPDPTQLSLLEAIRSDRQPERQLESTNDLNNKEDIDAVKACLGMLSDDLKKTGEVGQPQFGAGRRKRDVIRGHLRCLALFEEHPRRFLNTLVADMFNHRRPGLTIRDLTDDINIRQDGTESPSDLERLVMRMAAVVNQKRNQNTLSAAYRHLQGTEPLTIHEMKIVAGVPCDCSICAKLRAAGRGPILPPLPVVENWTDFEPEPVESGQPECPF
jgi:hypothetical protein